MAATGVVLLPGNSPPVTCGIGDYTTQLAAELRTLGIAATVWTRAQPGVTESDTVRTPAATLDAAGIRAFVERLEAERPAVVHLQYEADTYDNNGFALATFARAARRIGASLVTTLHALDGPRPWGKAHRLALIPAIAASRDIVVCSRRQYDALGRLPGVRARTHLIPVGSAFPVLGERHPALPGEPLRLIYFGFVWRGRNVETCVRALAAVVDQTPATLTIAGGIRDAAYRQEIEALAASLGVADRMTFTDDLPAPELSGLLSRSDIALLPFATGVSTGRTTFVATIEHGLPTVTMANADNLIPEFRQNENLLYVSPDDADGFVRETVRLATDTALRERIGRNTPSLAAYFSWPEIARKHAALPAYQALKRSL